MNLPLDSFTVASLHFAKMFRRTKDRGPTRAQAVCSEADS
jgi:hypothetical protein